MNYNFIKENHLNYLNKISKKILNDYHPSIDSSRMLFVFFYLSSLDILDSLTDFDKKKFIDFIYTFQIKSDCYVSKKLIGRWGFRSSFINGKDNDYDFGHITFTYCALCALLICGDDFQRLDRKSILKNLKEYQKKDGSFCGIYGGESDMRFVYCASAICYILNDFSVIDVDKMVNFIKNSLTYECAFGQKPGNEAHGASTYCAVASLKLCNKLDETLLEFEKNNLTKWLIFKQSLGFCGRPNKISDTCYTFWIGASLDILGVHHLINHDKLEKFCLKNQDKKGGFIKIYQCDPDLMHTYLCLSGLALNENNFCDLLKINPELNITKRTFQHLKQINENFKS